MQKAKFSHYAANSQEPNDHAEHIFQPLRIGSQYATFGDMPKELQTHVQIEDGADTNRAKEPNEQSLLLLLDLPNIRPLEGVQGKYNWQTAKKQNEDTKDDEPIDWNDVVMKKAAPGTDRAEPHEYRKIE